MKKYEEIIKSDRIFDVKTFGSFQSAFVKLTDAGTCSVVWSDDENGWEHVSIAPKKKYKTPSWNDMCQLKDIFFDGEEEVMQLHPKKSEYVNIVGNCLHLWKPKGIDFMTVLDNAIANRGK